MILQMFKKSVIDNVQPLPVSFHLPFHCIDTTTPLLFESFAASSGCQFLVIPNFANVS